ncbi:hypothetical protein LF817_14205 [Halobacillus sp. A1]|uniref:hypothetical protein n=1 Tax=Halobacillus sp. A1 TaxID=2880262 RepID=UPI0020A6BC1A|nr:hypothetical protein [Halobacillus sp. A1]MCP3032476.1 hypothetical protein [Halobacillus sp. A1]
MEKETEDQILNELKNINKSLEDMNEKIDSDGKPPFIIGDIIKSLLIGILILGPAIAVAIGIFQILGSWI